MNKLIEEIRKLAVCDRPMQYSGVAEVDLLRDRLKRISSLLPAPPDEPKWYEGLFKLEIPEGMTKDEYMQGVKERLDANLKPIFDAIEKAQENNNDTH